MKDNNYNYEDVKRAFVTIELALMMNRKAEKNNTVKRVSGRIKGKYEGTLKKLLKFWSKSVNPHDRFVVINTQIKDMIR